MCLILKEMVLLCHYQKLTVNKHIIFLDLLILIFFQFSKDIVLIFFLYSTYFYNQW